MKHDAATGMYTLSDEDTESNKSTYFLPFCRSLLNDLLSSGVLPCYNLLISYTTFWIHSLSSARVSSNGLGWPGKAVEG